MTKIQGAATAPQTTERLRNDHRGPGTGEGFQKVLAQVADTAGLRFSKHAMERISARGIALDRASLEKLDAAVDTARAKGGKESLVLMDELALIVSVKNRTVVTAMSSSDVKGNVFTSIDSAVIA